MIARHDLAHSKTWRGLIYLSAWQLEVSHPVSNGPDLLHPQEANPATYEGSHALGEREELKPADDRQGQATTDSALHDHLAPCTATVGDSKDSHRRTTQPHRGLANAGSTTQALSPRCLVCLACWTSRFLPVRELGIRQAMTCGIESAHTALPARSNGCGGAENWKGPRSADHL